MPKAHALGRTPTAEDDTVLESFNEFALDPDYGLLLLLDLLTLLQEHTIDVLLEGISVKSVYDITDPLPVYADPLLSLGHVLGDGLIVRGILDEVIDGETFDLRHRADSDLISTDVLKVQVSIRK